MIVSRVFKSRQRKRKNISIVLSSQIKANHFVVGFYFFIFKLFAIIIIYNKFIYKRSVNNMNKNPQKGAKDLLSKENTDTQTNPLPENLLKFIGRAIPAITVAGVFFGALLKFTSIG